MHMHMHSSRCSCRPSTYESDSALSARIASTDAAPHGCGAPFFGSICSARIRAPRKRTQSIGARLIVFT